ncbi:DUF3253 domain-containing protein [Phenylobacterium aquaticum]|uniref:DUF3253 domain-containing protein n=1 Tax=Phenylobacterium aquaticum TaxID=1763816 RepID=UPI0026EF984D|nr:DUF3253 domain-containing protein [Phenylobacterium aquaticum]
MSVDMEAVILDLLVKLAPGKSASSEEVARAADPERWRKLTGHVRNTARGLARQGAIVVTRHGKPADPETFKGVYRLRLPTDAERAAGPVVTLPKGDAE